MFPGAIDEREVTDASGRSDREDANFVVVGAPLDVSTTFQPGTRFGPRRIRTYAETFDDYDRRTDQYFSDLGVVDHGDVYAWDDADAYLEFLAGTLRDVVWDDAVPVTLGGEHTVSLAGVRAVEPEVFVCLDAHLDLREEYDGNRLSHACVTRRVLEDVAAVEEAIIVGARTGSEDEWGRAAGDDVTVIAPEDVGAVDIAERVGSRTCYLSVDIDGADPAYAPGTGTMEPFGLEPREMRDVVRRVGSRAAGFDAVEVNDRDDGQAASLAGKLAREFVYASAAD
ncbi:agmatinase [Natrarchaeobius halalkaliphilus]|uniref:Agmatinase n=1 Tax=Natrarchaeobius halalkaliphilus TaxID=1679091 RepID=A0A3N6LYW4_9EURY|nr:agmatinase [Natrarchaeobius halalkaliphilus]RQG93074.1 agmatinase [Natrarchaeobius halalkaliphilus]